MTSPPHTATSSVMLQGTVITGLMIIDNEARLTIQTDTRGTLPRTTRSCKVLTASNLTGIMTNEAEMTSSPPCRKSHELQGVANGGRSWIELSAHEPLTYAPFCRGCGS